MTGDMPGRPGDQSCVENAINGYAVKSCAEWLFGEPATAMFTNGRWRVWLTESERHLWAFGRDWSRHETKGEPFGFCDGAGRQVSE